MANTAISTFYPTYYFTPETNSFLHRAYSNIAQTRFDTSIRNHFISKQLEANFSREKYQTVDAFLMDEDLAQRKQLPDDDPNFKRDRTFKTLLPRRQTADLLFHGPASGARQHRYRILGNA